MRLKPSFRQFSTSTCLRQSGLLESLRRNAPIDIHPEVADALAHNKPVVALESTIITHGMPYPTNLDTTTSLERIVRSNGGIPATIALLGGRIKIGLQHSELEYLADVVSNPSVVKLSRRDIAPAIAMKKDGGTTCSGTLIFAALAGIKVFATGGLGGVHRGGENSMDISADLSELTRCPVGLVSSGVKSILDIGRTLEYLETLGVPVLSYAKTNEFPAFFTARSGFKAPWNVDDPATAAKILLTHWQLGMKNGALFGVPIPSEYEAAGEELQEAVELALLEAEQNGVNKMGKEATPWLLKRVAELTQGRSLTSNVALIKNTALVGTKIAVEYAKLIEEEQYRLAGDTNVCVRSHIRSDPPARTPNTKQTRAKLIVVGSAAVDISAQASASTDPTLSIHSTAPGSVTMSLGGVSRNIAEAAHRLLAPEMSSATLLISPIGNDAFGRVLADDISGMGMRTDGLMKKDMRSAVCNMVLDSSGNLTGGVADMDIIKSLDGESVLQSLKHHNPQMVALDGNLSTGTITIIVKYCSEAKINTLFEPTSIIKSTSIFPAIASTLDALSLSQSPVTYATPNLPELAQMYHVSQSLDLMSLDAWWKVIDSFAISHQFRMQLEQLARQNVSAEDSSKGTLSFLVDDGIAQMAVNLLPFFQNLVIKCGERGLIVAMRTSTKLVGKSKWTLEHSNAYARRIVAPGKSSGDAIVLQHFSGLPLSKDSVVNVTGAGDTLVGSILASVIQNPDAFSNPNSLADTMLRAQEAAVLTLKSQYAVSPLLASINKY